MAVKKKFTANSGIDATFTASGSASSRSLDAKLQEISLSATDFGAVGNNLTDDSAAFASLEAQNKGARVDLLGRTYLVSSCPKNCKYFNGHFRVASTTYSQPPVPLAHPLDGPVIAIEENSKTHHWPGPVAHAGSADLLIRTGVPGWRHSTSLNAPLLSGCSYDGGLTWEQPRVVWASATAEPRGLVGGAVSTSRYGVFYILVDAAGARQGTRFSYTDDLAANWTTVTVPTMGMYPHGEFIFDDAGGINVFGYGPAASGDIYRARSTDLGASWTVSIVKTGVAPLNQLVEPAVVRIAANKYIMFARNDAGGNMYAATSSDLGTWTSWADTGVALGLNPPAAIMAWGRLWIYMCARTGSAINSWENKLLVIESDADAVWAAGGVLPTASAARLAVSSKKSLIGYLTVSQLRDGTFIGYMIDGETTNGSANPHTTRLLRIGGSAPVLSAPALLNFRRRQPPITHNACFNHWTRGSSFLAINSATPVADRWIVSKTGSTIDVTQVEVPDTIRKILPASGLSALSLVGDAAGSGRSISQRFLGKNKIFPLLDRTVTMNCIFSGDLPGYYRARVTVNFGVGGSASRTVDFADCSQRAATAAITILTATGYTPNADGVTWGTNPFIQFTLLSNDAGPAAATIYALWWDLADGYIPLDPQDFDAERAILNQYTQRMSYPSGSWVSLARGNGSANAEVDIQFCPMVGVPTLTADAASALQINSTTLSAVSFDQTSAQSSRMIGTLSSGMLAGNAVGVTSVASGSTWSILADVKY